MAPEHYARPAPPTLRMGHMARHRNMADHKRSKPQGSQELRDRRAWNGEQMMTQGEGSQCALLVCLLLGTKPGFCLSLALFFGFSPCLRVSCIPKDASA